MVHFTENTAPVESAPAFSAPAFSAPTFAELIAKTNFSFLEGASHPEEMVAQAHALSYSALGIADKNGLYGVVRAHRATKNTPIHLIVGAEIFTENSNFFLLAKNREGYGNLCELLTDAHVNSPRERPHVSWELLSQKSAQLFCLLPSSANIEKLKELFCERLYLVASCFRNGSDRKNIEQIFSLSQQYHLPCIASNQPLFHIPERKALHDVLTCIKHGCSLQQAGFRLLANNERHLKSPKQMAALFKPFQKWLENTVLIAEQCQFSLEEIRYHYPTEWIPEGFTPYAYLEKLVWEQAHKRYSAIPEKVTNQIRHELSLINELKYSDYFLTIWDIVQFAKSKNILYQGRGSAANSIVCYVLEITAIDPVRMDLLFERFISRERGEPPDIDIDFEHERREEVIQYIYKRYGKERAAITAEVICFRRRSALREVGKAFAFELPSVENFLTLTQKRSLQDIPFEEWEKAAPQIPKRTVDQFKSIFFQILGFPRHIGTHVGGFVLCHELLTRNVPIEKTAMEGRTIIQWDKNDLDALGFVRVDILGLGILTCLKKCFEYLKQYRTIDLGLTTIPAEDPKVYAAIDRADTVGVFQIESRAQMNMLPRLRPRNFFDLVVEVSLVRPGPIQGQMVHPYLRRRSGREAVDYPHPMLKDILHKTFGVPLFQEQIMKIAMKVAGFTPGQADTLRKAMGSWREDQLGQIGEQFRKGLIESGIPTEFADRIFSQIEGFAEYGFPESHAASFAILAYASAYLKHYYPDIYLCAILNSQPMGFYSSHTLIHDAKRHGVEIGGVDVKKSSWDSTLEAPMRMRLGFREVKGLSKKTAQAIETLPNKKGGLFDFISQLKDHLLPRTLTKRELFMLAGANAFDTFGINRRQVLWEIQAMDLADSLQIEEEPTVLPAETEWEKVSLDYESQRVSLYCHPMELFRKSLNQKGILISSELKHFKKFPVRHIKTAGIVISRQMPPTPTGVLFITLEDEHGFSNLIIRKNIFEQFKNVLITQSFLLSKGTLQKAEDGEVVHLLVDTVEPLLR
ncbi:MAG: error-prone DNA polymerase [Deltaproteobacteria bacterium]|nr:error-prone DNA polymerase [Deltaproteobacteria bacterium]